MWTRKELKSRAKAVLHSNYWKAFLISLVIGFASGGSGGSGGAGSSHSSSSYGSSSYGSSGDMFSGGSFTNSILIIFLVIFFTFIIIAFALAFRMLIGYPLEVGGRKYFIQSAQYKYNSKCFRFAFNGQNYTGIIITMLLRGIYNFLWYLVFIIPGIIKSYAYRMVPYILADNPNIGYNKAIDLSIKMTNGHKFRMFVLDLSFIGWYLLGLLALIIGILFVQPYVDATSAELYLVLRQNALDNDLCSYDDLLLINPEQYTNYNI